MISAIAGLLVVGVRELPTVGTAVRVGVAAAIVVAATAWWVRKRDDWREKWRELIDAGRTTSSTSQAST